MTMPHSPESEYALIGSVLYDNGNLSRCEGLPAEYFYSEIGRVIWGAIRSLEAEGAVVSIPRVADFLGSDWLANNGGETLLLDFLECTVHGLEVSDCAKMIADTHQRRSLITLGQHLVTAATGSGEGYVDPSTVLAGFEGEIDEVREASSATTQVSTVSDDAEGIIMSTNTKPLLKTGMETLDHMMGGFERGALSYIAARPGIGKTALAVCIAANVAQSEPVGVFSLDVSGDIIKRRTALYLAWMAGQHVPTMLQLRERQTTEVHDRALIDALHSPAARNIYVDDRGGLSVYQIDLQVRAWNAHAKRHGKPPLGLVFIDHVAKVYPNQRAGSLYEKTSFTSNELLELSKRHPQTAFVSLAQLNRDSVKAGRRPAMSDVRDSGKIEEDAALIILMHREDYEWGLIAKNDAIDPEERAEAQKKLLKTRGVMELIIAKNRNAETGAVTVSHKMAHNVIHDQSPVQYREAI